MDRNTNEAELFAAVRADFPATERWTYTDVSGRDILSGRVRAAIDAHLDERMYNGGDKAKMFALIERVRDKFASFINADSDEIAYTKNISEGLNIVATALPWQAGDNVILCPELEHPNNVYPWLNLERHGLETRMVAPRDGHIPVDRIIERIDAHTRVVTVSSVTFAPGFRTEFERLGRLCRERGIFFLVDGAQSIGTLKTDVRASFIDGLSVSTQKGLLGLYGMGLLYVRREWAERMQPTYLARFGVDLGDAHEAAMGGYAYKLMPGARRFDLGNYNFLATAALEPSLDLLLEIGSERIERRLARLAHALAQGFIDLGLPICGGAPGAHMTNIVTVGTLGNGGHDGVNDSRMNDLAAHLVDNKVKFSLRRGLLRFSFHIYNNSDDVKRILDLTRAFLRK
ncbi:aminotransferase class V-fold PLP-dependent enzyme [Noviherbaspirillum sp.]|uniref:aminotransferase class V-fold PLP-dependent enzyme n=1 Tax=Noviherbaspirillum sp. TaxID=1926288 RepID=UPI002B46A703|nr:aminotransferase class V-fold PLP-dependent enzyme [Noviherbaspirillum sp.]HJV82392.1 aminotransferase class V-fold PLP-dependent enzyme [Noviherbaspirillum sp.]